MYENKEREGKNQSNPCFHLQLLSQEAYIYIKFKKKGLQIICEVKVLEKAQRSGRCASFQSLCAPAPAHQHPWEVSKPTFLPLEIRLNQNFYTQKNLIYARRNLLGTSKS